MLKNLRGTYHEFPAKFWVVVAASFVDRVGGTLIWQIDKMLQESGDKLDTAAKAEVEEALSAARQDLESEDHERIKGGTERLEKASHKLAEIMYKTNAAPGGAGPGAGPGGPAGETEDDVIDAEVVDEGKTN